MKKCSNCFQIKQLEDFYRKRDKNAPDKVYYQSRCKKCNAEVVFAYNNKNKSLKLERYFDVHED